MSETDAQTTLFVRDTMLPPQPAPSKVSGPLLWLRENMFSGPLNILLTLLGLSIVWLVVSTIGPWLMHSVWNANGMAECRQIIAERYGPDASGACFALIRERWNQFVFGFYPPALYWRPVMAFTLLFFALAPILFMDSRKARWTVLALASVLGFLCAQLLGADGQTLIVITVAIVLWILVIEYGRSKALLLSLAYPFIGMWLLGRTDYALWVGGTYVAALFVITFLTTFVTPETAGRDVTLTLDAHKGEDRTIGLELQR